MFDPDNASKLCIWKIVTQKKKKKKKKKKKISDWSIIIEINENNVAN